MWYTKLIKLFIIGNGMDVMVTKTVRVIANVPKYVAEQADQIAAMRKLSRSKLITECLLEMIEKRQNELLAEGYKAMTEKHKDFAKMAENVYEEIILER
jgi:hypothetical protein